MITRRSGVGADNRGVTVPLGTVLIFAVIMLSMGILQTTYFPQENHSAESNSHEEVMEDFSVLVDSLYETSADGNPRTTSLSIGVDYPTQFTQPLQNPSVLHTGDAETVRFSNVDADSPMLDDKTGETAEYETTRVVFEPDYWEWQDAPNIGIEHGLIYTQHPADSATIVHNTPSLVNGDQITIVLVEGDVHVGQRDLVATTTQAVDTYNTSSVSGAGDGQVSLTIDTRIPEDTWRDMLSDEKVDQSGHIEEMSYQEYVNSANELTLVFEDGEDYDVQISRVGVETAK